MALVGAPCAGCVGDRPATGAPAAQTAVVDDALQRQTAASLFPLRAAGDALDDDPSAATLHTQFEIWRFRIPGERITESDGLWDHLDESTVSPRQALRWRRNGVRLGVGRSSSWPAVRAMLLQHDPEVWSDRIVADERPILLELSAISSDDPLFHYDDQDRLCGARYEDGRMFFHITHLMDIDELGRLHMRVVPELRRPKGDLTVRLERSEGVFEPDDVDRFNHLAVTLTLEPQHYILIGPSHAARRRHLIGRRFLIDQEQGEMYENVYCIVPKIFRVALPPGAAAGVAVGSVNGLE